MSRSEPSSVTELSLAPALRLRMLGTGLAAIGITVALGVVVVWLLDLPAVIGTGLVALGVLGWAVLGLVVGVRRWVVRLDEHGYRVRVLRPQARSARWSDVLDLQALNVGRTRCVVLRLRDGRTTALPVDSIEGGPGRLTDVLTEQLDRTHGYRRLQ